ncbi:hypothetical protein EDC96DRAFT_518900 [Choanephora cucurbitarum]|nr:hypothetical protein EDC96DRAFT_518900 [Choanephora cucurbitarum]
MGQKKEPSVENLDSLDYCWWADQVLTSTSISHKDFVLISEFSELEGPLPLAVVTGTTYLDLKQYDSKQDSIFIEKELEHLGLESFDFNAFVLRVVSVDRSSEIEQLTTSLSEESSSLFLIPDDTQIYFTDSEHKFFAFTHHLTLFDINARGYVHPIALSYITRDPDKIMLRFQEFMDKFTEVSIKMKKGNYLNFMLDLKCRLRDLQYTQTMVKDTTTTADRKKPALSLQAIQQTITATQFMIDALEVSLSQITKSSLSLDTTIKTAQEPRFEPLTEPPVDYQPKCIDTLYPVPHFERRLRSLAQLCQEPDENDPKESITQNTVRMIPLVFSMIEQSTHVNTRTTLASTLMHNIYTEVIQSIQDIAHYFGKSSVILEVEEEEELFVNPVTSALTVGRTLMLNMSNPQPRVHDEQGTPKEEIPTVEMKRTDTECSINVPFVPSSFSEQPQTASVNDETLYYPILFSPLQLWKSSDSSKTHLLQTLGQYQSLIVDVIFSLLIGRTVLIQGSAHNKKQVQQVVRALSVFVPGQHKERHQIIDWFDSARLTQAQIGSIKLVGVNKENMDSSIHVDSSCVLDIDSKKGSLCSSPVYVEGQWINQLLDRMTLFTSDESYLAYLHTVFMSMSLKAFIYHHLYISEEFNMEEEDTQSSHSKGYVSETSSESSTLSRKWSMRLINYLKKQEDQDDDEDQSNSDDHSEENQATVTLQDIIGHRPIEHPPSITNLFSASQSRRDSMAMFGSTSSRRESTSSESSQDRMSQLSFLNFDTDDLVLQLDDNDDHSGTSSSDEDSPKKKKKHIKKHRFRRNSDVGPDGVSLTERRGRDYLQEKLKVYGDDQTIVVYLATCVL